MVSNDEILNTKVSIYKVYLFGGSYLYDDDCTLLQAVHLIKQLNKEHLRDDFYFEIRFK